MRRWAGLIVGAAIAWVGAAALHAAVPTQGAELIGTRAPGWDVSEWLNSQPLSLEHLRGRVVLVRWWTGPRSARTAQRLRRLSTRSTRDTMRRGLW